MPHPRSDEAGEELRGALDPPPFTGEGAHQWTREGGGGG
jgi:hypothetical protein